MINPDPISPDPTKAADELDKWAAGLEQRARRYNELQQRLERASATESTQDGAIRVTVDSNGVPTRIEFSERARDLAPSELSTELMACLRRAQARLRAEVEDLVQDTVPADDEPARNILAQYQQRFPDPPDSSAEQDDHYADQLGRIEDEPPPPSTPPPGRSPKDRPTTEDDWDDESPLR